MKGTELKEKITELVREYVKAYPAENGTPQMWRTPLVGFADVNDPYIRALPEIVDKSHQMPENLMENPNVIISYFIPFTKELAQGNVGIQNNAASESWADAYKITNTMMAKLNTYLAEELVKMGHRAAVSNAVMDYEILKSNWSHRHIAYAAGLGTFGINNMMITKDGCCGRYNSIVANIPVEPDHHLTEENCLYKSKGICKKCVENCFTGALTTDGFDRKKCFEACEKNMKLYGVDVCGKCVTNIPCAFVAPGK